MFHSTVLLFFLAILADVCLGDGWNPSNFSFNPDNNYKLVWQDEFENVGPVQAIINGQPAYAPNPNNWAHRLGYHLDSGIEKYTNSVQNAYVQNNQLLIVAMQEGYKSAMLSSCDLQEFTFGIFAAKIRVPYGKGMWPAWWMVGNDHRYNLSWPTTGEIDIMEMYGGTVRDYTGDLIPHATVHWNNASDSMNPLHHKYVGNVWKTPDGSMLHNNSLIYWTEWTSSNIRVGVNQFTYFQVNTTNMTDSVNPVVAFSGLFPYCMRLDIAVSSAPAGPPDNTTVWPQQMVVDWVRVYQHKRTSMTAEV